MRRQRKYCRPESHEGAMMLTLCFICALVVFQIRSLNMKANWWLTEVITVLIPFVCHRSKDEVIEKGTEVAVVTRSSGKVVVALGQVARYLEDVDKYEVVDATDNEEGVTPAKATRWRISRRFVRELTEEGDFEFKKGARVTAIYPGTTCFYPATVVQPAKKYRNGTCGLEFDFEDDDDKVKKIPARHVLPIDAFKA